MTKVLYVEDNDDNVYMLKMRLELLGDFEVVAAEDGEHVGGIEQGMGPVGDQGVAPGRRGIAIRSAPSR